MNKTYHGAQAVKKVEKLLGRSLNPIEKRVVEVEGYVPGGYTDTKGIFTSGVGQTGKYQNMTIDDAIAAHTKQARKLIPSFDSFPVNVQAELVQGVYRGDIGGSPLFRKLLNEGKYSEAATEFLNNDEYKNSKTSSGIKKRMEAVAKAVRSLESQSKPDLYTEPTQTIQAKQPPVTKERLDLFKQPEQSFYDVSFYSNEFLKGAESVYDRVKKALGL